MKAIVSLIAVIAQLLCLVVTAAKYGYGAGILVLIAIFTNAIQAAMREIGKKE